MADSTTVTPSACIRDRRDADRFERVRVLRKCWRLQGNVKDQTSQQVIRNHKRQPGSAAREVRRVSDVHIFQPRPTKRKDEDDSSDRQLYHIHIQLIVTCIRPSKIRASMPICVRAADVDQVVLTQTFVTLVLRRRW